MDILQPSLFDESEMESKKPTWTEQEENILHAPIENQVEYIKNYFESSNIKMDDIDNLWIFLKTEKIPPVVTEIINKNHITLIQLKLLFATQEEKIQFALKSYAQDGSISFICDTLFCKKSLVYKWINANKKQVLEMRIDHLQYKVDEYDHLQCYPDAEEMADFIDAQLKKNNIDLTKNENNELYDKQITQIANDIDKLKEYISSKHSNQDYAEKQLKQYRKYVKDLEKAQKDLLLLESENEDQDITGGEICTTATKIPNDIVINDFYDLLTYYDNLEKFAQRQSKKSHSLDVKAKITESEIILTSYKANTKQIKIQMNKPASNVNMTYIRDLFVIAMQHLAKIEKENLRPENLRLNPIYINISTLDYYQNSNYKNLRQVQEMSKDEYIKQLGTLSIFGKSEIYDGKGKSKKILKATNSENSQKAFIQLFKKTAYQNNTISLSLNDEFPWHLFTLKYFSMLPDNYLQLSENAKTLLYYLCSQARIKRANTFKLSYSDLQLLLNLKSYEEDKIHATERIIKPIHKAIEEVNANNSYFICIDEQLNMDRTPKEILETGYITVTCKNDLKNLIENINDSQKRKIEKSKLHRKGN